MLENAGGASEAGEQHVCRAAFQLSRSSLNLNPDRRRSVINKLRLHASPWQQAAAVEADGCRSVPGTDDWETDADMFSVTGMQKQFHDMNHAFKISS